MFVLLPTTAKQVNYHPLGVDYFDTLCTHPPPHHLVRMQIMIQQLCNVGWISSGLFWNVYAAGLSKKGSSPSWQMIA